MKRRQAILSLQVFSSLRDQQLATLKFRVVNWFVTHRKA